jgi:hypothetical protein
MNPSRLGSLAPTPVAQNGLEWGTYPRNANTTGFVDMGLAYGLPGDKPVGGDWAGNGTDTIGVYRNGTCYLRHSDANRFADAVVRQLR